MTKKTILILTCILVITSCITPKQSKKLKKSTKDWRKSSIILEGYSDSPLSSTSLVIRGNGKFEHTSSGLIKSFRAGNWINNQDTITLSYVDHRQILIHKQKVIIDKETSTLIFEGNGNSAQMRMKVIVNKL